MQTLYPLYCTVLSVLLSVPLTYAGEWMSAGNAPIAPYHTPQPAQYKCQIAVLTSVSGKQYRIEREHIFKNSEFQLPGMGVASLVIKGEADPGMDGQQITLRFSPDGQGGEDINLSLHAVIKGRTGSQASAYSTTQVARTVGAIRGEVTANVSPRGAGVNSRSANVAVSCLVLP